jgi:hypothetical protein
MLHFRNKEEVIACLSMAAQDMAVLSSFYNDTNNTALYALTSNIYEDIARLIPMVVSQHPKKLADKV